MGYCCLAMANRALLVLAAVCMSCGTRSTTTGVDPKIHVFIGATAIPAQGARSIPDAVIVVSDGVIRSVGERKDVPIPQDSVRTDVSGRWILPEPGHTLLAGQPANLLVLEEAPAGDVSVNSPQVRNRIQGGNLVERN